ncbi:MAG: BREX-1 system adenine-specific DNA-methyltransferase PglX [Methyloprofundus sp.]|nr:BREX-1 system adenine-specific DNA-methyltransferase PglX [Methyloprofundus sp.]
METAKLKKFAQFARRSLIDQVTSKLVLVLAEDSAARRESMKAVKKLEEQISEHGEEQVIEKIAYIWFNRFCALRFMDVNRYTRIGLVSPAEGQFQPEILAEAKMGHIDEDTVPEKIRQQIFALLGGTAPSRDPQTEAYRLLVVAACNDYHKAMPYLFERIADYTELLMPDDLLSGSSILAYTREAMTPDVCQDVEVIGWLYQFYISEKKDAVFDGLKKNKKITPENIPAATQLFTPHWIVRYLVENSLGRLWMLNRPNSPLKDRMPYYITTEHTENTEGKDIKNSVFSVYSVVEKDFLVVNSPEEIKICDPACGSGHMLVYAFDLLYAIYEEEGVDPAEIPEKILTHNLYGIEIDERAGELAAFALTMKARAKQRRFFRKPIQPNICVLENIHFDEAEINEYMDFVGQDIFTPGLKATLSQFEEADNFGSLIRPEVTNVQGMLEILNAKDVSSHLFYSLTHEKVLQVLNQADFLSPKYHVVIANPPYMGGKGMNGRMGAWVKDNYPNSKSDLFAMFIERGFDLVHYQGYSAMVTMQSWMFLSSYEKLRVRLLNEVTIECMAHMANMVMGIAFGTSATVWCKSLKPEYRGAFCYVEYEDIGKGNKPVTFPPLNARNKAALG